MTWLRGKLEVERSEREEPKAVIFRLKGSLIDSRECYDLLEDVRGEIRAGYRDFVLDLTGVKRLTSAGVGLLAACYTSITRVQGRLHVSGVSTETRMLLELVNLWSYIKDFDTAEEALASLG
ncbi:MAG: STAS domain-containing protein [Candidatus Krumholzibacteriota bacterium]|nr:STAS domain-containing protein [Candidatus Krumholzibacteriota bacterium]